jgi:hypothetical protein
VKKRILFIIIFLLYPYYSLSLDLEDGILIDDSITLYHEMGNMKKNVKFIVRDKMSKAYSRINVNNVLYSQEDFASVGSIILGVGSVVHGDIIIIDQSVGDKTAISTR